MTEDPSSERTRAALERLYADALEIYEIARREVTIARRDGTHQKYAATRYKQQIDKGYENGLLPTTIASIVKRRTTGFGHLEEAGRPDLMLETLVLDRSKPYHHLFSANTIQIARTRIEDYERRQRGQQE